MRKIVSYMVLNETGGDVSVKVNELIALGWQPIGGIAVVDNYGVLIYHQTMVKYEEEKIDYSALANQLDNDQLA